MKYTVRLAARFGAGCAFLAAWSLLPGTTALGNGALSLRSPDGTLGVAVNTRGALTYDLRVDGQPVLRPSKLGLQFRDGALLGADVELREAIRSRTDFTWENRFGKRRAVRDQHNELRLRLREKLAGQTRSRARESWATNITAGAHA